MLWFVLRPYLHLLIRRVDNEPARVERYNPAFFQCTDNIVVSIGQGSCLLVDREEEVSVDCNFLGTEVVYYCIAAVGLKSQKQPNMERLQNVC